MAAWSVVSLHDQGQNPSSRRFSLCKTKNQVVAGPKALALLSLMLLLPALGIAEDASVGLSQRLLCYTFSVMGGTVGMLVGFVVALYGLWTIIQGKMGWGLFLILGGAMVTAAPQLIGASFSGMQGVLEGSGISDDAGRDVGSIMSSMGSYSNNCDQISVDMSAYVAPPPGQDPMGYGGGNYYQNPDGTYSVINPDGTTSKVTNEAQARSLTGRYYGESTECVALVKEMSNVGHTSTWAPGTKVQGTEMAVGTPIATFCSDGSYCNRSGTTHAALYMGQNADGSIRVLEQYNGQPAQIRTVRSGGGNGGNNADNYYAIAKKG